MKEKDKEPEEEEEKSEDSLLDHSFIYKGFLDEEHFQSKLKEQFTLVAKDGVDIKKMKLSTKVEEVYDSASEGNSFTKSLKEEPLGQHSRVKKANTLSNAGHMITSPRSSPN